MESIWTQTTEIQSYDKLTEDMTADAVVIGGGMAGILTAYKLTQNNIDTIVLEASRIGSGQTKNTTAKITSQHDIIYSRLTEDFGEDLARQYAAANENAIREYKRIIEKENIDCNFEEKPAYLYSQNQQ
ncbi:MAG TPA: FAD-binding oxidoreductase, partial [Clostridiales bacterium]|nr:FAD-binding oxidoreductase [Clostridiales bacterium]